MATPAPSDARTRLTRLLEVLGRPELAPDLKNAGVFAHLRLRTVARELDVFFGNVTKLLPEVAFLEWRSAPLTEVLFSCEEGEDYALDIAGRDVEGFVLERNVLELGSGRLQRLETPTEALELGEDGRWQERTLPPAPRLPLRAPELRARAHAPLDVPLDPAQLEAIQLPPADNLLILGEAGFGKTTVALHRLLHLRSQRGKRFRGAVIVPSEGLRRLTEMLLERQHAEGFDVHTYDRWAAKMGRRVFMDLPRRDSEDASADTIALKRSHAVLPVLDEFVRAHRRPLKDEDRPSKSKALARRVDLEHFFGDRDLLARIVQGSHGALRERAIQDTAEHTRVQFLDPAEVQHGDVDADRLAAVDAGSLDSGTPTADAHSVDVEDHAVLFELERLRAKARNLPPADLATYDVIVADEAQELAPLELALIGRALKPRGCVIVSGDAAQQVDPSADFTSWPASMTAMGIAQYQSRTLAVSYRCPPEVTALAQAVRQGTPPPSAPAPRIVRATHRSAGRQVLWLLDFLRALREGDPTSSVAIICRTPSAAGLFSRSLRGFEGARLALEGNFDFRPGIVVTSVTDVKGLEFDYVLLPDVDEQTYSGSTEARRALYVALTRATHGLLLSAVGRWTPLLGA